MISETLRALRAVLVGFWGGEAAWGQLRRLLGQLLRYRVHIAAAVVCMLGYNFFNALPAWYAKDVVDSLSNGEVPKIGRFVAVGFGVFLIYAIKGSFHFSLEYLLGRAGQLMIHRLRSALYRHALALSFGYYSRASSGDLITRFTSDLLTLQNALRIIIIGPIRDIPMIFLFLGILAYRSWQLFLLSAVLIPIALWLISRFGQRTKRLTSQRLASFGEMTGLLNETIRGIRVVKAFSMEGYEQARFERANDDVLKRYTRTIRVMAYSLPVLEIIGSIAGAGIIIFGGFLIIHDVITPGDFVSFLLAFFMISEPVRNLNSFQLQVQEGMAAAERVNELLDSSGKEYEFPDAVQLAPISKGLSLDVRSYTYDGRDNPALADIHIKINVGQVVALVGTSGAGKTTLVNLIPRFFELDDGAILIDGQNIRGVTLASLRKQIAIVTQEIFLFDDTVANNIAYGNPDCPPEQVEAAAKAAYAHEFIMAMPMGYATRVGEGGASLSGGQRQRLSIARALIKDAPILILDEATSALDSESEQEVQNAIAALIRHRTTIVIAHRLSTIRHADQIVVMEAGRIVEQGQHDQLLHQGGLYKRLHDMQFRDSEPSPESQHEAARSSLQRIWQRLRSSDADVGKLS